jgi:predicted component of type VI protein secretion system
MNDEFFISVTLPGTPEHFVRSCKGSVTVGREKADILLAHPLVSRLHAALALDDDGFRVTDLGSTNGTTVNDEALGKNASTVVKGEPLVQVGPYILRLTPAATQMGDTLRTAPGRPAAGRIVLDRDLRVLYVDGKPAVQSVTGLEYKLLDVLSGASRRFVPIQEIGDSVWGAGLWDVYMLHNLVRRIRRKLEAAGLAADELIVSVPGGGYRLV